MEDSYLSPFANAISNALGGSVNNDVYISSFSEKPDLISQWRGYCPSGKGVCIGFKREVLEKYCHENNLSFNKCIYNESDKFQEMSKLINQCAIEFPMPTVNRTSYYAFGSKQRSEHEMKYKQHITNGDGKEQADAALSNLRQSITKLAPLFKNNGFHDESEWRVVAENPTSTIHFRAGNSNLIPYITLPILQFSNSAIGEVIIGPNENLHNCVDSISMLLETNGIDGVNIIPSKLPLQHW